MHKMSNARESRRVCAVWRRRGGDANGTFSVERVAFP
jgi:hypothetical protein